MQSHDLKKAGLKATTPRLRILEALREGAPRHLSAEDLYRRLTEATQATEVWRDPNGRGWYELTLREP